MLCSRLDIQYRITNDEPAVNFTCMMYKSQYVFFFLSFFSEIPLKDSNNYVFNTTFRKTCMSNDLKHKSEYPLCVSFFLHIIILLFKNTSSSEYIVSWVISLTRRLLILEGMK